MADPIGATLTLDISDVKRSLTEANKLIKENEANWRINAAAMGDWTKSEEGLNDRMRFLSKTIEQQEKNVEGLVKARDEAIAKYGKESYEVQDLNSKIITQSKNLEKSRKEYDKLTDSLEKMTKENSEGNDELEDTAKQSKKASRELDKLEKEAKDAGDGFSIAGGAIATFAGNVLSSLVSSIGSAVSSLFGLTEATLEYRREMARVTTVADQVGVSGDRIIDKWIDMNAVIQDESSVTEGLNNLMTAGFTAEKELDAITKALEGASIQWAETLKFEGLSDSLQEWIGSKGASLTGQFAELLERLGYNLDDVTEATKGMTDAQRRNWAIQTLNKAGLDDVSEGYRTANKDMIDYNKAQADLLNAQSLLGEAMQPFSTLMKQSSADILYAFVDMVNGVEGAGDRLLYSIGYMAGQIYKGVSEFLAQIMPELSNIFPKIVSFVSDNLPSMVEQGVSIATSIIDGLTANIGGVTSGISTMINDVLNIIADSAPSLLNSALELFGQLVIGLSEAIVDLAENLPNVIQTVIDGLMNGEQSVFDTALDVLLNIVEALPSIILDLANSIPDIIQTITGGLEDGIPKIFEGAKTLLWGIIDALPDVIMGLAEALPDIIFSILDFFITKKVLIFDGAVDLLTEIVKAIPQVVVSLAEGLKAFIDEIVSFFTENEGQMIEVGKGIVNGIIDGIKSLVTAIADVASWLYNYIVDTIRDLFGISDSSSDEMKEKVGKGIVQGIVDGIKSMISAIGNAASWLYDNTIGKIKGLFDGSTTISDIGKGVVSTLTSGIKATLSVISSGASWLYDKAVGGIRSLFNGSVDLTNIGKNVVQGIVDGIQSMKNAVENAANWVYDNTVGRVKKWLGIASPSKVMRDEVGIYIAEGLAVGIKDGEHYVAESAEELVEAGIRVIKEEMQRMPEEGEETAIGFAEGFEDGMKGVRRDLSEATEEAVEGAAEDLSVSNAGSAIAEEIGTAVSEAVKDYSKYVDISTDLASTLKEGSSSDIAEGIFGALGQLGGAWGAMADSIWSFISDNLLGMSKEEVQETAEKMLGNLLDTVMALMNDMPSILSGAIEFMRTFAVGLIRGIPEIIRKLPEIISEMVEGLISEGVPAMFEVGGELIRGLIEGMFNIGNLLWNAIKGIGQGIVNGFKKLFGIRSPSKVMADEVGRNLALGIEGGLVDNLKSVNGAIRKGVDASVKLDGVQRKQVNVYQTNHYAEAHSRYELYKSKQDTANAVRLAMQGA